MINLEDTMSSAMERQFGIHELYIHPLRTTVWSLEKEVTELGHRRDDPSKLPYIIDSLRYFIQELSTAVTNLEEEVHIELEKEALRQEAQDDDAAQEREEGGLKICQK